MFNLLLDVNNLSGPDFVSTAQLYGGDLELSLELEVGDALPLTLNPEKQTITLDGGLTLTHLGQASNGNETRFTLSPDVAAEFLTWARDKTEFMLAEGPPRIEKLWKLAAEPFTAYDLAHPLELFKTDSEWQAALERWTTGQPTPAGEVGE